MAKIVVSLLFLSSNIASTQSTVNSHRTNTTYRYIWTKISYAFEFEASALICATNILGMQFNSIAFKDCMTNVCICLCLCCCCHCAMHLKMFKKFVLHSILCAVEKEEECWTIFSVSLPSFASCTCTLYSCSRAFDCVLYMYEFVCLTVCWYVCLCMCIAIK